MKKEKEIVTGVCAAGFLIGISVKYLYECYFLGFSDVYSAWYYPILDFVPVLAIGLFVLYRVLVYWEVGPLNV